MAFLQFVLRLTLSEGIKSSPIDYRNSTVKVGIMIGDRRKHGKVIAAEVGALDASTPSTYMVQIKLQEDAFQ